MTATFSCANCGETFCQDGLQLIVHDVTVGRICPSCLAGTEIVQISIGRSAPGKPYEFQCFQVVQPEKKDD